MITELEIMAAVKTLAGSDNGRDTLERVLAWLETSGGSLDSHNQRAAMTLLIGAWTGKAGTVRETMEMVAVSL